MNAIELSRLSLREKFEIMESIWEDLRSHVDRIEIPLTHREILDGRRRRVENGEAGLLDWDQMKHRIGNR